MPGTPAVAEGMKERRRSPEQGRDSDDCPGSGNIASLAAAGEGKRRRAADAAGWDAAGVVMMAEAADAAADTGPVKRSWGRWHSGVRGGTRWLHELGWVRSDY